MGYLLALPYILCVVLRYVEMCCFVNEYMYMQGVFVVLLFVVVVVVINAVGYVSHYPIYVVLSCVIMNCAV